MTMYYYTHKQLRINTLKSDDIKITIKLRDNYQFNRICVLFFDDTTRQRRIHSLKFGFDF